MYYIVADKDFQKFLEMYFSEPRERERDRWGVDDAIRRKQH